MRKYIILESSTDAVFEVVECESMDDLLNEILSFRSEFGVEEEDIEVYELGRKGVMPKRTIQFV